MLDERSSQPAFSPLVKAADGYFTPEIGAARRGQGTFRLMVMDAYERRCAITGERTLPVLEAAHIRRFADHETHEVRNGIVMRSDPHKLYDTGLVTVEAIAVLAAGIRSNSTEFQPRFWLRNPGFTW